VGHGRRAHARYAALSTQDIGVQNIIRGHLGTFVTWRMCSKAGRMLWNSGQDCSSRHNRASRPAMVFLRDARGWPARDRNAAPDAPHRRAVVSPGHQAVTSRILGRIWKAGHSRHTAARVRMRGIQELPIGG